MKSIADHFEGELLRTNESILCTKVTPAYNTNVCQGYLYVSTNFLINMNIII